MSALYSIRSLARRFGSREVLSIDSLDIAPHEICALLGDNGAGKSTLLRILAFLDSPSGGELFFRGQKVAPGQEARFRPGVVLVPQFPVMLTGTLLYNVEYPMTLKKTPPVERRDRALELLESVGLGHLAKAPAHKLSGGESQRAAIARALAAEAEVILFDEPTASLDQQAFVECVALIRSLWEQRKLSIMLVTHNAALAATLCRRQIFLVQGKLVHQHVLPGGSIAWPARLSAGAGGLTACIISAAALPPHIILPLSASLRGLEELAAGVLLRFEPCSGLMLDILIENESDRLTARSLTLGNTVIIGYESEMKPELDRREER